MATPLACRSLELLSVSLLFRESLLVLLRDFCSKGYDGHCKLPQLLLLLGQGSFLLHSPGGLSCAELWQLLSSSFLAVTLPITSSELLLSRTERVAILTIWFVSLLPPVTRVRDALTGLHFGCLWLSKVLNSECFLKISR